MSEWQPISSARDLPPNTQILVYRPLAWRTNDEVVCTAFTTKESRHCWGDTVPAGADGKNFTDRSCYPSHWMPLPAPPFAEALDSERAADAERAFHADEPSQ